MGGGIGPWIGPGIAGAVLLVAAVGLVVRPEAAPNLVALGLASGVFPLAHAWRAALGTALRPAVGWAGLALAVGVAGQIVGSGEAVQDGRPWSGHLTYLACLSTLATLIMVLNARRPGAGAWAILMGLLVLVFLIPWLEGSGLGRRGSPLLRLRLEMPWSLFFGLLVVTGVTNYLPTRAGPAALAVGIGLGLELAALVRADWPPETRARAWSAVAWFLALGPWLAEVASRRKSRGEDGLERAWLWFRDAWGVAWALRVQERFNRASEAQRWPVRLAWPGLVGDEPKAEEPEAARPTFQGLVRRFAEPERVAEASGGAADP